MEWLIDLYDSIKAFLFEGSVVDMVLVCHEEDYSTALELAQSLRQSIKVPVSVKIASSLVINEEVAQVEAGLLLVLTNMSASVFNSEHYMITTMAKSLEA